MRASHAAHTDSRPDTYPWNFIDVRLLAKLDRPQEFKGLSPIALPATGCKMFSRVMLRHCETSDEGVPGSAGPDRTQLGFRETFQCPELVAVLRSTVEATDWGHHLYVCQLGFAQAYDSIRHSAFEHATRTRGVATPVIAGFLRVLRSSRLKFHRSSSSTPAVRPNTGLRQGCSLSPVIFRWVVEDCMSEARAAWNRQGLGFMLREAPLQSWPA